MNDWFLVFAIISQLCFCWSYFPQLRKTWQTRSTGDMSMGYWFLAVVGYISGLVYFVHTNQWVYIATFFVNIVLCIFFTWACWAWNPERVAQKKAVIL